MVMITKARGVGNNRSTIETTIPMPIRELKDIKDGDELEWKLVSGIITFEKVEK